MSAPLARPVTAGTGSDDEFDPDTPAVPPEERFWKRYNSHLEFPTSVAISILTACLAFGFVVFVLVLAFTGTKNRSPVPMSLFDGGDGTEGAGMEGSGGTANPIARGDSTPTPEDIKAQLPSLEDLPKIKEEIAKAIRIDDPNAVTPISDEKAASIAALDEALRQKIIGQRKGDGNDKGTGNTGQAGAGVGGNGADSTRARSMRWILRFQTNSGRNYLDQLQALGAVVTVPLPPDNKEMYIFRDLANPKPGTKATDSDLAILSQQIKFCDIKRDSARAVGEALNLNFTPSQFWAFFPRELEAELSRKEVQFQNRRPEDIEETIFQVSVRGGQYTLVVADQRLKR